MQRKWNDDTNQLIAQLSDNVSKLYSEGRTMRMNLLEHLLAGEKREEKMVLTKKEETSKEILTAVEEK
jgi:hypothetical protein